MAKDTVFDQILKPITKKLITQCVNIFESDYHYETMKTYEHLQTMLYAQINSIQSLRTLEVAINSQKIGIMKKVSRSTLSDVNAKRPAKCFFWILEQLMTLLPRKKRQGIRKVVKILDSSPIQLKGKDYDLWAKNYKTNRCQGLKLHVELDLSYKSPSKMAITYPNYNDSSMGKRWPILPDTVYVFDKGYCDFNWWWSIHKKGAYFVTRLKKNTAISIKKINKVTSESILQDGTIIFKNKTPRGGKKNLYIEELRLISVKRKDKEPLVLVTNIKDAPSDRIADLYKSRWEIELFFKWVKQNFKIKKFLGYSENAVKIQLATSLIAFLLIQIFKIASNDSRPLSLVLFWVRYNLHVKGNYIKKQGPPVYPLEDIDDRLNMIML